MITNEANIEKAVNWWAEHLNAPGDADTGFGGIEHAALVSSRARTPRVTDEQIARFRIVLADKLRKAGGEDVDEERKVLLRCDYHPMGLLAEALAEAGIQECSAPTKTNVWVGNREVTLKHGYGADIERL